MGSFVVAPLPTPVETAEDRLLNVVSVSHETIRPERERTRLPQDRIAAHRPGIAVPSVGSGPILSSLLRLKSEQVFTGLSLPDDRLLRRAVCRSWCV